MRKKITTILPLYLASIILLTFVVFPHHHHDHFICFNTTHCSTSANEGHHHSHDQASCVTQLLQSQLTENTSRQQTECGPHSHTPHFFSFCCTLVQLIDILSFDRQANIFPDARDEIVHSFLLTSYKANRAPPFC